MGRRRRSSKQKILTYLIVLMIMCCGYLWQHYHRSESPAEAGCQVTRVVDGDTIWVDLDGKTEKVRLIGIDTPESVHPNAKKNVPYGKVASAYTKNRLLNQQVQLEYDVQERDRYGRILAYVYLNGDMVNLELVKKGHAKVATFPPNVKYVDTFTTAQREARAMKVGMWNE